MAQLPTKTGAGSILDAATTVAQQETNFGSWLQFLIDLFGTGDSASAKATAVDTLLANGSGTASIVAAATTDLATLPNVRQVTVTNSGAVAIASFGSLMAGAERELVVSNTGTLTLTYNAVSMIIPGAASVTLFAGDTLRLLSLGSGNWRVRSIVRAWGEGLRGSTAVATTSGTSVPVTGIPAGVKRVTIAFNGVSTTGTSIPQVQLGAGSVQTTGYSSSGTYASGGTTSSQSTTGLITAGGSSDLASTTRHGHMVLTNVGGNSWVASSLLSDGSVAATRQGGGQVTLSGTLDRINLTTVGGTDTFDAGAITVLWE